MNHIRYSFSKPAVAILFEIAGENTMAQAAPAQLKTRDNFICVGIYSNELQYAHRPTLPFGRVSEL